MSGWSDEGPGERPRRAGTAGARPQKPLPPEWNVRPGQSAPDSSARSQEPPPGSSARPQKPLPPGWSVRPRGMRQGPTRDLDAADVQVVAGRPLAHAAGPDAPAGRQRLLRPFSGRAGPDGPLPGPLVGPAGHRSNLLVGSSTQHRAPPPGRCQVVASS